MVESFWQIPDITNIRTPVSILREQASALTQQTNGLLVGVVQTKAVGCGDELHISLQVSVPALNGYRHRILMYTQKFGLYPGELSGGDGTIRVADEDAFIAGVKEILASPRIAGVLTSLLTQVAA